MYKLHKYALELEWSGGRGCGEEVDGVGGGQGGVEKGKGGHTMTVHEGVQRCAEVHRGAWRCAEGCARWCASHEGPGRQKSGSGWVRMGAQKLEIGKIGVVGT